MEDEFAFLRRAMQHCPEPLTVRQLGVLMFLAGRDGPQRFKHVIEQMPFQKPALTRAAIRLQLWGMIERHRGKVDDKPHDGRDCWLVITQKGREVAANSKGRVTVGDVFALPGDVYREPREAA